MQTKQLLATGLIVISSMLTACNSASNKVEHSYEYLPLSQFTIDSNAIAPGSPVKIIAYSGGEQSGKNKINYYQFIVVNKASGDTLRVLTALINVPGDSEKGTFTPPSMFDGNKGVFEATFEPKDSMQNMMINIAAVADEKDVDVKKMEEFVSDTSKAMSAEEWVIVNKSIPIFENPKYKTTIGVLKFGSTPW